MGFRDKNPGITVTNPERMPHSNLIIIKINYRHCGVGLLIAPRLNEVEEGGYVNYPLSVHPCGMNRPVEISRHTVSPRTCFNCSMQVRRGNRQVPPFMKNMTPP